MFKKWLLMSLLLMPCSVFASDECSWIKLNIEGPDGVRAEGVEVRIDHGTVWGSVVVNEHQFLITRWAIEPDMGQRQIRVQVTKPEAFLLAEYDGPVLQVITMHLRPDTSAGIIGRIVDENGRGVSGVKVGVDEFPGSTITDVEGRFRLDLRTGDGKTVRLHGEKEGRDVIDQYVMAGKQPVKLVCECHSH